MLIGLENRDDLDRSWEFDPLCLRQLQMSRSSIVEQPPLKRKVVGASPTGPTNFNVPVVYVVRTPAFQADKPGANPGRNAISIRTFPGRSIVGPLPLRQEIMVRIHARNPIP